MYASEIYEKGHTAGLAAGNANTPIPMIIGGDSYPEGACGFAWVKIKPARAKFVSYLKKAGIGDTDRSYGGYIIWISEFGQSMSRKEAYAKTFSEVLNENGINAQAMSRMD